MIAILWVGLVLGLASAGGAPGQNAAASGRGGKPQPSLLPSPRSSPLTGPASGEKYELHRVEDGSGDLTYKGSQFSARVKRNGTVTFEDNRSLLLPLLFPFLPVPVPRGVPTLESVLRGKRSPPPPQPDAPPPLLPRMSPFRPDPAEICQYPSSCFFEYPPIVLVSAVGSFDVNDIVERLDGKDPHRLEKARFLAATRDMRVGLAARAHAADVRRAASDLDRHMQDIAADRNLPPDEQIAILRALAAELDTATPEGQAARARIAAFIDKRYGTRDGGPSPASP